MTDYPYRMQLAEDEQALGNFIRGGQITIYASTDTALSQPLALKHPTSLPMSNPVTTTPDCYVKAFGARPLKPCGQETASSAT